MRANRILAVTILAVAHICGAALPSGAQQPAANGLAGTFKAYAGDASTARVSAFSGLPVPRYSSLKFGEVNGRAGPSADYPVAWSYHRAGLPVVIVRESEEWRKIRDPQGDEVWVHRSQLAGARTAVTTADGAIRVRPDQRAEPVARFAAGAIVALGDCKAGWCQVQAAGRKGFAPTAQLWGASQLPATRQGG